MLPNLSALNVTGVNNASVFVDTPGANQAVADHHLRNDAENVAGAVPCWVAVTRPDVSAANALAGIKFSLPCELYYLHTTKPLVPAVEPGDPQTGQRILRLASPADDTARQVVRLTRPSNAQVGVDLSGLVRFNSGSRIEVALDTDTQVVHEFQISMAVITAQSEAGKKIAEYGFGLRGNLHDSDQPNWQTGVYNAAPDYSWQAPGFRLDKDAYDAARMKLRYLLTPIKIQEPLMLQVQGNARNPGAVDGHHDLKNWLPRLQNDVIFYYVECLTDRSYPPMVGAYCLATEDPTIERARASNWKDAFKTEQTVNSTEYRSVPVMRQSVANDGDPLRTAEKVIVEGYAKGLITCPAKNFLFCRANTHELTKPESDAAMDAAEEFEHTRCGLKRHRSEAGPSAP